MFYVHKYSISRDYGGPEEGGWYYTHRSPVESNVFSHDDEAICYEQARILNDQEQMRREENEQGDFYSVLAYRWEWFAFSVEDEPIAVEPPRPFYE